MPTVPRTLRWLLAAVAVVAALVAIVMALPDWNWLRDPIARAVAAKTGRVLRIGGDLHLSLQWPDLHIRVAGVTFSNPPWTAVRNMIEVGNASLDLAIPPLFDRRIVFEEVRLDHAVLDLEQSGDGRKNWLLDREQRDNRARVFVRRLGIGDGRVTYLDPEQDTRLDAAVATREASPGGAAAALAFSVHGRYKGQPLVANGSGDSVLALREQTRPYRLAVAGRIGQTDVRADGRITNLLKLSAADIQIAVEGDSLAQLYPVLGVVFPDTPPYKTSGRLVRSGDEWRYERFAGQVGKSDIAGTLRVDTGGQRPSLTATLTSTHLNFADLGPLVGSRPGSGQAAETEAENGRVLPQKAFRTGRWNRMDADVRLEAQSIERPESLPISKLSTHLRLRDGDLTLDPLQFDVAGGTLAGSVHLDGRASPIEAAAKLQARKIRLAELFPTLDRARTSIGEFNGTIDLKGQGDSVATMLGSADGHASMIIDGGEVSKLMMETVSLHLLEMLQLKLTGDEPVRIRCGIADFAVTKGVMRPDILVLDTDVTRIDGNGQIDLGQEALDLTVLPKTRKLSLMALRTPIHVRGSFAHPQPSLDKGRLALRGLGAAALGAVNPALALIPLIDAGSNSGSECRRLIEEAKTQAATPTESRKPAQRNRRSRSWRHGKRTENARPFNFAKSYIQKGFLLIPAASSPT
ncbi:MAG: AsmA family protein [Betaproteobacteria bacterium]|nr:AsmA family protein [Betaproteobacteria bacterium]